MNHNTQQQQETVTLERLDLLLALLAASGGDHYDPSRLEKSMFLLTRNLADVVVVTDGHYNFLPYNFGPVDLQVLRDVKTLADKGLASVTLKPDSLLELYSATQKGNIQGNKILEAMPANCMDYIKEVSQWVRTTNFFQLVASIYADYPDMKPNGTSSLRVLESARV